MPNSSSARATRKDRGPGILIPPPLYYVAWFTLGYLLSRAYPVVLGDWILPVGTILLVLAGTLGFSAVGLFARLRTGIFPHTPSTRLVIRGPYLFTRNPMYLALALLQAGLAILADSVWALLFTPLAMWTVQKVVIRKEERYLEAKFGHDYRDYRRRVRRWL